MRLKNPIIRHSVAENERERDGVDEDSDLTSLLPRPMRGVEPKYLGEKAHCHAVLRHLHGHEEESGRREYEQTDLHEVIEREVFFHTKKHP